MRELRARLVEVLALKDLRRSGWVRIGVKEPESVAAHSWGVAWLVLVLCPETLDRGRAIEIAILHDLAETRVGDITPHDRVEGHRKRAMEAEAMQSLVRSLPRGEHLYALWREYEDSSTAEGRFVKACDKLDMALQAGHYADQGYETREFVESALDRLDDPTLRALLG